MKKTIIFSILCFTTFFLSAQTNDSTIVNKAKFQYCEIVGYSGFMTTKLKIDVDFGQEVSIWNSKSVIKDETGKDIKFNSMIDALNYMGTQGWEFVQAYDVTMGNTNVYHFLMKREIDQE